MGLYALTEIVIDDKSFSDLLMLFLCSKMGPESVTAAVFGQRKIIKKIIETLTTFKSNLIVSTPIGETLYKNMVDLPLFL